MYQQNMIDNSKSLYNSPQLECAVQSIPNIQPPLEYAASNHEKPVAQHPDLRCNRSGSGTIDSSIRSPIECQSPSRLGEDLGNNQKGDDVESGMCVPPGNGNSVPHPVSATPCTLTKPANNSPRKGTRNLRNRASKSTSRDPKLDAIRAENMTHDAQLQKEFGKEHGISRHTRSRTKQRGVQIVGFGVVRKQKKSVKFSPMYIFLSFFNIWVKLPICPHVQGK
ncbi:hypothetical protein Hanom_Chr09g00847961 [Helianthus anomalus]